MKSRRSLIKQALGLATVASTVSSAKAITTNIQPIGITNLVALLSDRTVFVGATIRFYVQMTIDDKPAPACIYVGIQERIGSRAATPRTIALRPTECCGWAYYDYVVPATPGNANIYLSACYGGRGAPNALTASQSPTALVQVYRYGVKPV
ncbi:MAG: hypothetical protein ACOYOF_05940 [Verrucomicrobiaceae bacterium]